MENQAKLRSHHITPKYMYGYEIPFNYEDAMRLDILNGNTLWQDCTKKEMDQLHEFNVFINMGRNRGIPNGYQKM